MKIEEFRARFDELRRMRGSLGKYVVLSDRLTELVEAYLEATDEERFQAERITITPHIDVPPHVGKRLIIQEEDRTRRTVPLTEPPVGDDHFFVAPDVETRALLAEAAWEIVAHKEDVAERAVVSRDGRQFQAKDLHVSGTPEPGAEPVAKKTGEPAEDKGEPEKPPAGTSDSTRSQDEEPRKPCKDCGETKPLSEFTKRSSYPDGHTNQCLECNREYHRRRRKKRAKTVTQLPRSGEPGPEDRLCASGERCVKADPDDLVPTPAILDAANDHPSGLCRGCQKKAGIA